MKTIGPIFRFLLLASLLVFGLNGCVFRTLVEQQKKLGALCQLWGDVRTEQPGSSPLVVVLTKYKGGELSQPANWEIFDHFVLEGPGRWFFAVSEGTYGLAAFADKNGDLIYQPEESALRVEKDRLIQCRPGTIQRDLALVIPTGGRLRKEGPVNIAALQARAIHNQMKISLGALMKTGDVVRLDDPRFGGDNPEKGLWQPFDFLFDAGPGLYFLEPYDSGKTPVLFVHGMQGTPRDFQFLIDNLDRRKFQPWVFYYPSGGNLNSIADFLEQAVRRLQSSLKFKRSFLVAHSMGGLVSRAFILKRSLVENPDQLPLFVSISSPWNGHEAAESGVKHAPAVIRSWYDMAPNSPFLSSLFFTDPDRNTVRRPLPKGVTHHLLFGFQRKDMSMGKSDDGTITLASQLRQEAQNDAAAIHGFDDTHTGILNDPEVSAFLNRILEDADR